MKRITLHIEGMSCTHCEKRVEKALKEIKNLISSKANFENKTLEITYEGELDLDMVKRLIEAEGYKVQYPTKI